MAVGLNNLALLYNSQGQYAKAEPLYKRALAIWEKALGPEHPAVAFTLENLGELYLKVGKENEAVPLLNRVRKIRLGL